jgi:geranylgeranyl diphosphate synthase, type II
MNQSAESFVAYASRLRAAVDAALDRALPHPPECPDLVAEAMHYTIRVGGKRVRPILTLASAEAVARANGQGTGEALRQVQALAMPAACAVELIHTYSLVHDDLPAMDNDCLRRGQPTLHVIYGDGLAVLAGDGLLAEAFALLACHPTGDGHPDIIERQIRVLRRIAQAVGGAGMVGGQAIDLECAGLVKRPDGGRLILDAEGLRGMHARKTGLLIRAAAVSGAIVAGGHAHQIDTIDRYASEMGIVFQIVDDILDIDGSSAVLGKTPGKDQAGGRPTYPSFFGVEQSRALAEEGTRRALDALKAGGLESPRLQDLAQWVLTRHS